MNIKNKLLVMMLAGALLIPFGINAATPSDFGLKEGNLIRAAGDNDIFIINQNGYKRLFLNPVIFNMYGHLGGWSNVKTVTPATRDAFLTSNYYRVDGDTKVYKLEQTGDDTGMLRWVNVSQSEFLANASVNQIFTINNNEFGWYAKGADFTFSPISSDKAVINTVVESQTVTKNAAGFTLLNVKFNGTGSVDTLSVKRLGFGENEDYGDGIYLYKDGVRLTEAKSFNSDRVATFNNLKLKAPFVLSVVTDFDGTSGNIAKVELQGSYNGLPLQSNSFTISGADSGSVSFVKSGTLDPVIVEQKNAQVSEFQATVAADNEDVTIKHIELFNAGNSELANVRLSDGTTSWDGIMSGDRLVFNPNLILKAGKTKTFKVYADLLGDSSDTVKLYIENPYDVYATGNVYGFGVVVDSASFSSVGEFHELILGSNGTVSASTVSNDKVVALWGDTSVSLFQFKLKANDESFKLDELSFNIDEDIVKKLYVYSGDTLVGSETVDGNMATVSSDFVLTGEKTFTVKADLNVLDASVSESFKPKLVTVKATGVGSDKEVSIDPGFEGKDVYVFTSYPKITRTDSFSSNLPLTNVDVLKLSVKAIGGDIKLASTAFTFDVDSYGMPNDLPYKVLVGSVEYGSGTLASTSSTFAPLASNSGDELFIAEGDTKEITFRFNFSGADANRGFQLTLPNVDDSVVWFSENKDGDFEQLSSTTDTLGLPIESTQFYRETN